MSVASYMIFGIVGFLIWVSSNRLFTKEEVSGTQFLSMLILCTAGGPFSTFISIINWILKLFKYEFEIDVIEELENFIVLRGKDDGRK